MNSALNQIRNIPVTSEVLASLYPEVKTKWKKIEHLEKEGEIIRLRRNLYVANPECVGVRLSMALIANHLLAPSYVSMCSALRYYGLIPENVYTVQSMTFKSAREYDTPVGRFSYMHISKEAYPVGLVMVRENGAAWVMATPEKALCDLVANTPGLNLRFRKDARAFLEEDLRFDMERLADLDRETMETYAKIGKKGNSIRTILNFLNHE